MSVINKLKTLSFTLHINDIDWMNVLVGNNVKTLEFIYIDISGNIFGNEYHRLFTSLSNVKQLKALSISCMKTIDKSFPTSLTLLSGNSCLKSMTLFVKPTNIENIISIFQAINRFPNIRRFYFETKTKYFHPISRHSLPNDILKNCRKITHLTLNSYIFKIDDQFITNIVKRLPHLQNIRCNSTTISSIALKLKSLKFIHFWNNNKQLLSDESVIIDMCRMSRKLQSIFIGEEEYYVKLNDCDIALIRNRDINNEYYPRIIKDSMDW